MIVGQLDALDMLVGQKIVDSGLVSVVSPDSLFAVKSTKDPSISYEILHSKEAGWMCSCPVTKYDKRRRFCKHIAACQLLLDRIRRGKILAQPAKSSRLLAAPRL